MINKKDKVKILISDTTPLYPPFWGGPKRIWGLYGNFPQELFDITYVGIDYTLKQGKRYSFKKIRDNFKEILCGYPAHYYLWNLFEKIFIRNKALDLFPYLWMHTDRHFRSIIDHQGADVLVCSHPWMALSMRKKRGKLFIYDAHNCEYLLMDKILGKHILKKFVLKQVKNIEQEACNKSDLILACSENEKRDLISLYKIDPDKIIITSNGTNIPENPCKSDRENSKSNLGLPIDKKVVLFIGSYYKPNIDAVRFILEDLVPELGEVIFLIVGSVSCAFKKIKIAPNVKLLGQVPEERLTETLKVSDIAINPVFDGSGINIKMLDYMSYGLPIVTTECGARGIEVYKRLPMVVSSFDKFADNIRLVLSDNALHQRLSRDSKSLAADTYDWAKISGRLQTVLLDRLGTKPFI